MKLLFICTHNRCRSILAEAITRHVIEKENSGWQVRSAGSQPAEVVYPGTLNFLQQQGIRTEGLQSQSWDEFEAYFSDSDDDPVIAITVCDSAAGETCPVWFGKGIKAHWGLPDPSKLEDKAEQAALFAKVSATLTKRIQALLTADIKDDAQLRQLLTDLSEVG
ncbi:arsenate reductase ArsC [Bacterioplanoides sp. SCSIO 12839]|uniref:arsenate reductase ArsC n=1 Tax=Bacterioplanoides sp. SCSIO 12839 TaxID=2829569 RepID=UPI002102133D|nr:arsenate reductase ArsC [Bacterioplanoides sp. SCSIO 12839]UTW49333.1 arsenate reductase ArsC [Bacterioplanoides sp. SCSIO 12839]